jgi:hypothetical protein
LETLGSDDHEIGVTFKRYAMNKERQAALVDDEEDGIRKLIAPVFESRLITFLLSSWDIIQRSIERCSLA